MEPVSAQKAKELILLRKAPAGMRVDGPLYLKDLPITGSGLPDGLDVDVLDLSGCAHLFRQCVRASAGQPADLQVAAYGSHKRSSDRYCPGRRQHEWRHEWLWRRWTKAVHFLALRGGV